MEQLGLVLLESVRREAAVQHAESPHIGDPDKLNEPEQLFALRTARYAGVLDRRACKNARLPRHCGTTARAMGGSVHPSAGRA